MANDKSANLSVKRSMINLIAGMTKNKVIGNGNALPWNIPEDLQNFRRLTTDSVVIMGRKTFESIGRPLPKRVNIVITSQDIQIPGVQIAKTLQDAINFAKTTSKEVFIIGGAQIYKQALEQNLVDKMYLSIINKEYPGDVFFPAFDEKNWDVQSTQVFNDFSLIIYSKGK